MKLLNYAYLALATAALAFSLFAAPWTCDLRSLPSGGTWQLTVRGPIWGRPPKPDYNDFLTTFAPNGAGIGLPGHLPPAGPDIQIDECVLNWQDVALQLGLAVWLISCAAALSCLLLDLARRTRPLHFAAVHALSVPLLVAISFFLTVMLGWDDGFAVTVLVLYGVSIAVGLVTFRGPHPSRAASSTPPPSTSAPDNPDAPAAAAR